VSIQIICMGCGERGEIDRPEPEILHACGSKNVDLWDEGDEGQRRIAARRAGPEPVFTAFLRAATTQPPMPRPKDSKDDGFPIGTDPEAGWDEYPGPGPHPNGLNAPAHTETKGRAPTRPVPGQVNESNLYVYDKHDPHPGYGENPPAPLVAEHGYDDPWVTKTPFLGQRRVAQTDKPGLLLKGASCPRCGTADTSIVPDHRDHAHWFCGMKLCGSLADLDQHPEIDPFHPPRERAGGWGQDEFRREKKRVFAGKKDGQVLRRIATIGQVNPGLSLSEAVHLARQSVIQYPEA
jgi:ribosomal protein S27AE